MIDWHRYSIEEDQCSECRTETNELFHKEAKEKFPPTIPEHWAQPPSQEIWQKYYAEWYEQHPYKTEMCFVFVADCQGDAISLCLKHFREAMRLFEEAVA